MEAVREVEGEGCEGEEEYLVEVAGGPWVLGVAFEMELSYLQGEGGGQMMEQGKGRANECRTIRDLGDQWEVEEGPLGEAGGLEADQRVMEYFFRGT